MTVSLQLARTNSPISAWVASIIATLDTQSISTASVVKLFKYVMCLKAPRASWYIVATHSHAQDPRGCSAAAVPDHHDARHGEDFADYVSYGGYRDAIVTAVR